MTDKENEAIRTLARGIMQRAMEAHTRGEDLVVAFKRGGDEVVAAFDAALYRELGVQSSEDGAREWN